MIEQFTITVRTATGRSFDGILTGADGATLAVVVAHPSKQRALFELIKRANEHPQFLVGERDTRKTLNAVAVEGHDS